MLECGTQIGLLQVNLAPLSRIALRMPKKINYTLNERERKLVSTVSISIYPQIIAVAPASQCGAGMGMLELQFTDRSLKDVNP
jgi:hypothetical protein